MHRWEIGMRVNLLGENTAAPGQKPHIRALSETKAIATGAVRLTPPSDYYILLNDLLILSLPPLVEFHIRSFLIQCGYGSDFR